MTLSDTIAKWVVNDYFTPNIKAEVILDTLLSQYIHELVEGTTLVAKEMSIPIGELFGSKGPKIDYVLAGDKVYLVELKTTGSSDNGKQANRYVDECQGKCFGDRLGMQLLSILGKKKAFGLNLDACGRDDDALRKAFDLIVKEYGVIPQDEHRSAQALALIREKNWTQSKKYRSRKYLYTLGQLADYPGELWEKTMQVVYLAPDGTCTHTNTDTKSLQAFTADLLLRHPDDALARLLDAIIKKIYGG